MELKDFEFVRKSKIKTALIFKVLRYGWSSFWILKSEDFEFLCEGTVTNKETVLTAAHCIIDSIELSFNGRTFNEKVVPNEYYPSYAYMYKVYLGFNDISSIKNPSTFTTGILVDAAKVIRVSFLNISY